MYKIENTKRHCWCFQVVGVLHHVSSQQKLLFKSTLITLHCTWNHILAFSTRYIDRSAMEKAVANAMYRKLSSSTVSKRQYNFLPENKCFVVPIAYTDSDLSKIKRPLTSILPPSQNSETRCAVCLSHFPTTSDFTKRKFPLGNLYMYTTFRAKRNAAIDRATSEIRRWKKKDQNISNKTEWPSQPAQL